MLLYARLVSETHPPKVSLEKREELKQIQKRMNHQPRKPDPKSHDRSTPMFLSKINQNKEIKNAYKNIGNNSAESGRRKSRNIMARSVQSYSIRGSKRSRADIHVGRQHNGDMNSSHIPRLLSKSSESKLGSLIIS